MELVEGIDQARGAPFSCLFVILLFSLVCFAGGADGAGGGIDQARDCVLLRFDRGLSKCLPGLAGQRCLTSSGWRSCWPGATHCWRSRSACWAGPQAGRPSNGALRQVGGGRLTRLHCTAQRGLLQTCTPLEGCPRCWSCWRASTALCAGGGPRWWPRACRTTRPCRRWVGGWVGGEGGWVGAPGHRWEGGVEW